MPAPRSFHYCSYPYFIHFSVLLSFFSWDFTVLVHGRTQLSHVAVMPLFSGVCRNAPVLPCMSCRHPLPWYGCKLSSVRNVRRSTGFHIRFLPVATQLPLSRFHPVRSILPAGCLYWNRSRSTSRCGNSAGECVATTGEELTVMQCQFLFNRVSPVG